MVQVSPVTMTRDVAFVIRHLITRRSPTANAVDVGEPVQFFAPIVVVTAVPKLDVRNATPSDPPLYLIKDTATVVFAASKFTLAHRLKVTVPEIVTGANNGGLGPTTKPPPAG